MTMFSALHVARTGVGFAHHWLDSVAHNLANANTMTAPGTEPFRALRPVVQPLGSRPFAPTGSGVVAVGQVGEAGDPALAFDPTHPLADEDGYVQLPMVDVAGMMADLMIAQRHYQANVRTVQSAREAYQSALRLGAQ